MLYRIVSWTLMLGGLLALCLGGYSAFAPEAGPYLRAQESNIVLQDCLAGQRRPLFIRLRNDSGRPIAIIGAEEC